MSEGQQKLLQLYLHLLTFKVEVDKSGIVLHIISDFTLIASVILQCDILDDH